MEGRTTEFALTGYSDRLLVVASQLGSLGSILAAEKEAVLGGGSTYQVDTLLGEVCWRVWSRRKQADVIAGPAVGSQTCVACFPHRLTLPAVASFHPSHNDVQGGETSRWRSCVHGSWRSGCVTLAVTARCCCAWRSSGRRSQRLPCSRWCSKCWHTQCGDLLLCILNSRQGQK